MGRWTQYDEDEYRLPAGMKRIGYDADTGKYQFRDSDGSLWQGAEGAEFSEMTKVSNGSSSASAGRNGEEHDMDDDLEAAPIRSDGYQALATDSTNRSSYKYQTSNASAYRTLFPFFLLIAVVLLLVWRLVLNPGLTPPKSPCPNKAAPMTHWVQAGESCWEIAKTHGCSLDQLRENNPEIKCEKLMPGSTICLPEVEAVGAKRRA